MPCPMRRFIPELREAYAPGNKRGRSPGRTLVHQMAATKPIAATLRNRNRLATKDVARLAERLYIKRLRQNPSLPHSGTATTVITIAVTATPTTTMTTITAFIKPAPLAATTAVNAYPGLVLDGGLRPDPHHVWRPMPQAKPVARNATR